MTVSLFVPCYQDAFFPRAALAAARVIERLGHTVKTHPGLACCGQPAFNSGYWDEARPVARRAVNELADAEAVVVASGSCAAMMKVFYPQLFHQTPEEAKAEELATKVYEFSSFLVDVLGVTDVGASFPHQITFHDGCHGLRELGVQSQPRQLLDNVQGLELVEMNEAQTCCGFGGAFAAKFSDISVAMGEVKLDAAKETGTKYLVSNDSSCMMHLQGLIARRGPKMKCMHLAEVLAETGGAK